MRGRFWTDEMDQQLRLLYDKGLSCSMIANEMDWDLTRNAIIGRVHRLKLDPRGAGRHPRVEKQRPPRVLPGHVPNFRIIGARVRLTPMVQAAEPLLCAEVTPRNLALMDLQTNDCRYPTTEDSPFLFCGLKAVGSYCAAHERLSRCPKRTALSHAERLKNRRDYMAAYRASKRMEISA